MLSIKCVKSHQFVRCEEYNFKNQRHHYRFQGARIFNCLLRLIKPSSAIDMQIIGLQMQEANRWGYEAKDFLDSYRNSNEGELTRKRRLKSLCSFQVS